MTRPGSRTPWSGIAGGAVITACAACCAGPGLAVLAALGVTTTILAVFLPVAAVALLVGAGGVVLWRRRARSRASGGNIADLGLPTAPDRAEHPPRPASPGAEREPGTGQPDDRLAP